MHTGMYLAIQIDTHAHTWLEIKPVTLRQVTRVDEYNELSGLPELDFLPALVPQELSRLLEAVRSEQELQRPRGFGWQKS